MKCLLFGGASSVGKSETVYRLTNNLLSKGFIVTAGWVPPTFSDFKALLEGMDAKGVSIRIIINSATDTPRIINDFKIFYDSNNGKYDMLISSVRDHNFWPRGQFFSTMGINSATHYILEIPLAKITRQGGNFRVAVGWYERNMDNLIAHVISLSPFNL